MLADASTSLDQEATQMGSQGGPMPSLALSQVRCQPRVPHPETAAELASHTACVLRWTPPAKPASPR